MQITEMSDETVVARMFIASLTGFGPKSRFRLDFRYRLALHLLTCMLNIDGYKS